MKTYTDIEQSKKLVEFLPLKSADTYIGNYVGKSGKVDGTNVHYYPKGESFGAPEIINSWSLAALLQILPIETYIEIDNVCFTLDISRDTLGKWFVSYHNRSYGSSLVTYSGKELLNVCYEMILKLHEFKLL